MTISRWLSLCETRHLECRRLTQHRTALRSNNDEFWVIDVNERRLCKSTLNCEYVALSYVWGERSSLRACNNSSSATLSLELLHQTNVNSPLSPNLPQTIEDAITVTQGLGQRYLWVDLLCIDQSNSSLKEKAISSMDRIFGGAFLTICVLDGSTMFSGIPGIQRPFVGRFQVIADTDTDRYICTYFSDIEDMFTHSDWQKRAWTFQEGELTVRRLCFSQEGVFLICKEEVFHDLLELDESEVRVKGHYDTGAMYQLALGFDLDATCWDFDTYARLVASYSHRSMTFPSDAHNAIAGAIRRMTESSGMNFIAALPLGDLCNALLWLNPYDSFRVREDSREGQRRPGFPSWSWLGWEGLIEYEFWLQEASGSSGSGRGNFHSHRQI